MRADDPSPLPAEWLKDGQLVLDMVYRVGSTALVREAERAGARTADGLGLLVAQGALAIDIWAADDSGQMRAPRDVMRAAAEAAAEAAAGSNGGETE
jgi:shikimate dehydrogenase